MQKEASLQAKGLELFLSQSQKTDVDFSELEKMASIALRVMEKFLFSGKMSKVVKHYKLDSIIFNVELCSDEMIRELNDQYRQKDKITDVLSFPTQDDLRNYKADIFIPELELGDIFICSSVCVSQAKEFNISTSDEFVHLMVHGFLHICGFDHEISEKEEKIMQDLEVEIMDEISIEKRGTD